MKKVKFVFLAIFFVSILSLWWLRWRITMDNAVVVPDEIYCVQDEVEFGENFFWDSSENSNGYSITVLNSTVVSTEEFYGSVSDETATFENGEESEISSDYIYDVTMTIKNRSNDGGGVRFSDFILIRGALILRMDLDLVRFSEPDLSGLTGFSIPKGKEITIHLPFTPDPGVISINEKKICEAMKKDVFYLCVSQYPNRILIRL